MREGIIQLPDYRKIASEVEKREVQVQEKEVEQVLKQLQLSRAKLALKEGPAQKGDLIEIEYSTFEIEGGRSFKDAFILGKGLFVPGFEDNLVAMKAGQEKSFSLRFPKEYFQKNLAGKELTFNVKVGAVKKVELPYINDGFAKRLGKFKDLNVLKKSIKQGLRLEKEAFETQRRRREVLDKIREVAKISLPAVLIEKEKDYLMEDLKKRILGNSQESFKTFLKRIKKTEKEFSESLLEAAEKRIENSLIIREISRREDISVSENEVKDRISEMLKNYPLKKAKDIDQRAIKDYTKGVIIEEKVFQFLENVQKSNYSKNS